MPAPSAILKLIERFELHRAAYLSPHYNETQTRRELIDPFFKALGWDIDNEQGYAETYKDVIHEDSLRVGGTTKAPDYCFRIGGARQFFVETKRPSVNIKRDAEPAFQLRRYAWTAKLSLSILTDFEEFAVYDCRLHKPDQADSAAKGRILYLTYREYADRWDDIAGLFSREAILRGSFDRFATVPSRRRGTAEVDVEFLKEIEGWRSLLARNVALRNPQISQQELNFAVQRTIDRIVFLRICEDRGIERPGQLQALLNEDDLYDRLRIHFRQADDRYNSGLFHFHEERDRLEPPDALTLGLSIDDAPLRQILRNLYYPDSPYEFSVLPADILGQVYEQFLGKTIRLTAGHQAKIEEKPEVRKSGGVFYTPTYVVRYIVDGTIGEELEGKSPQQAAKLRVLDPACGSGSFLIEAYQKLLDWHRDYYAAHGPANFRKQLYQSQKGDWRLTTSERKRILLNNIYGVDIDPQAVEVTKLSLLLKVLEGETEETLSQQLRLFHERALPDLANNIKCGNTLIGPDYFNGRHLGLLDQESIDRLSVFDWKAEFPKILKAGGFDVVIGNPPYVRMEVFKEIKDYLRLTYRTHAERTDLYVYFLEREHALLREGGRLGMIVSNKFLRAKYGEPLRAHLNDVSCIERIVDLAGLPVFKGATVRTIILLARKQNGVKQPRSVRYSPPPTLEDFEAVEAKRISLAEAADPLRYNVASSELRSSGWSLIRSECSALMKRLRRQAISLREFVEGRICRGIVSGLIDAFVIDDDRRRAILRRNPAARRILRPFLQGRQIRRYKIEPVRQHLIYTHHGIDMEPYPAVLEHLRPFRDKLRARATKQEWYELQQPQLAYVPYFEGPKIVFPDMATGCRFALDTEGRFGANTMYFIPTADLALLGLLNSRLAYFYFQQTCAALEGPGEAYLRFFGQYLEDFPVRLPEEGSPERERLIRSVEQAQTLYGRLSDARTDHAIASVRRQIEIVERQIDEYVFKTYEVSEDDRQLIHTVAIEATEGENEDPPDPEPEE